MENNVIGMVSLSDEVRKEEGVVIQQFIRRKKNGALYGEHNACFYDQLLRNYVLYGEHNACFYEIT